MRQQCGDKLRLYNVIIKLKTSWKFQAASNIHPKMAAVSSFCIIGCIGHFIWLIFSNFASTRKILLLMYVIHASFNKSVKNASHTNVWFTINNPWKVVIRNFCHFFHIIIFAKKPRKKLPFFKINCQTSSKVLIYPKVLEYANPWQ